MKSNPILFLLIPLLSMGQSDTIFTADKRTIPCDIIWVKNDQIKYRQYYDWSRKIRLSEVVFYSEGGARHSGRGIQFTDSTKTGLADGAETSPDKSSDSVTVLEEIDFMKYCFRRSQKQGKIGLGTMILGASFTTYGAYRGESEALLIGGIATIVGLIITWDSYKWMDRAGLGLSHNRYGVGVKYRFK